MASEYIYVHLDSVTNSVLSKGVTLVNYAKIIKKMPKNILLLNAPKGVGELDAHTGFRIIRGTENVAAYFKENLQTADRSIKWIDFENMELLRQLTPVEISELLYIAHAYMHLHSPFYYKLQNNFIYLTMPDDIRKIYFRYLEQFYGFLGDSLTRSLEMKINEKKKFFQKSQTIEPIPVELVRELVPYLREGALFSFKQMQHQDTVCEIPIFLVEDRLRDVEHTFSEKDLMGTVCYDNHEKNWFLKEEDVLEPLLR